jgi:uncharacterized protein
MLLSPEEARVLGALVEKELTTPQHYPLTENSLVLACNQTTGRNPVVSYNQSIVRPALIALREQGLVRDVRRSGERSVKHRQLLDEALGLDRAELAVVAVLLLRGPQTLGELRTRTERMHGFESLEAVQTILDRLANRDEPLVGRMGRQPGQKEARYTHLLADPDAVAAPPAFVEAMPVAPEGDLSTTVRELERRVAELEAALDSLRNREDQP